MKNKTLKDFTDKECFVKFYPARTEEKLRKQRFIDEDKLKKEAIKWVKELKGTDEYSENEGGTFDDNINVQKWIKHFFNITEEDLK